MIMYQYLSHCPVYGTNVLAPAADQTTGKYELKLFLNFNAKIVINKNTGKILFHYVCHF